MTRSGWRRSMASKQKTKRTVAAADRLATLLDQIEKPSDVDAWTDAFFDALHDRVVELESAEECVFHYFAVDLYERQLENGGLAQAFVNYGFDSELAGWCVQGYRAFGKTEAAAAMKQAIKIAKRDAATLSEIAQHEGKKKGIELYLAYRKRGTFTALEKTLREHAISSAERRAFVQKRRKHFLEITQSS